MHDWYKAVQYKLCMRVTSETENISLYLRTGRNTGSKGILGLHTRILNQHITGRNTSSGRNTGVPVSGRTPYMVPTPCTALSSTVA